MITATYDSKCETVGAETMMTFMNFRGDRILKFVMAGIVYVTEQFLTYPLRFEPVTVGLFPKFICNYG